MKLTTAILSGLALGIAASAQEPTTLKAAFKNDFLIGTALNPAQFCEANQLEASTVKTQFNSISPENVLKWESIHPKPGTYNFTLADRYVDFGLKNHMFTVGHTLIWHSQTPGWVFKDDDGKPATREVLLQRMREHIFTVVGRYKGKVNGWDVINEVLEGDGSLRQSPWMKIIGEDYIQKAFEFAHEADPQAELYYNDYGLEDEPKRKGAIALVEKLKAAGVKIDGIGIQEHVNLNWPTTIQLDETLSAFAKLGVKTMVTELDVDVLPAYNWSSSAEITSRFAADPAMNPYTNGLPSEVQKSLADRYAQLFSIYLKHTDTLKRVTLWGVTDGDSWLNGWPIPGRTAYPLLFDREGKSKKCFYTVIRTARHFSYFQSASSN
jgi:endo-1,4-beta-xylanase